MAEKRKSFFKKNIVKWILLIPTIMNVVSHFTSILGWEVRRAGKSLIYVIMFSVFLGCLLTASWLCLLALLGIYLYPFLSLGWILTILFFINLIVMIIIAMIIARLKNHLFFTNTTQLCRSVCDQI